MNELPHADISHKTKDRILNTPKGKRYLPEKYMTKQEIDKHLALFDEGVVKIQSKEAYENTLNNYEGNIGDPDTGTFVLPKSVVDKAVKASDGEPRVLEKLLLLMKDTWEPIL